jgi:hypothetical protein
MDIRRIIVVTLAVAWPHFAFGADRSAALGKAAAIDPALSNGHWECHCMCLSSGPGPILQQSAEIPGRCDVDTEGSSCQLTTGDQGELSGCSNVFVIDG